MFAQHHDAGFPPSTWNHQHQDAGFPSPTWNQSRTPLSTQSFMSPPDMPPEGSVHKVTSYPGYFHSQNNPNAMKSPQPP
eukprot:3134907-Prorocentrum_lima.AAC.1